MVGAEKGFNKKAMPQLNACLKGGRPVLNPWLSARKFSGAQRLAKVHCNANKTRIRQIDGVGFAKFMADFYFW
jgi:hypothetical protein